MVRTKKNVIPSFDEPESFVLEVQQGNHPREYRRHQPLLQYGHHTRALRSRIFRITGNGSQISRARHDSQASYSATCRAGWDDFPLTDGRIRLHVDRLSVLKLPVKGLLGDFHVTIADLMGNTSVAGVEASQNDIYLRHAKALTGAAYSRDSSPRFAQEPGYRSHVRQRGE